MKEILVATGSVIIGIGIRYVARQIWQKTTGNNPPINAADPNVKIGEAAGWAVTLAVVSGLLNTFFTKTVTEHLESK